ncbi:MAG TPA: preprotein translocase subunit SecG [Firmicutes bacterium]|uniref:Protein-export membrane protein SecG n=1 Tax=Candidatus Fermentithermobacillus carboniphilus TaxID=3085328 RepID=A0AAT9LEW9_9FIRM|nr:MAG: preprotein translocase subunit SecG [Candidatus Fermentithermobacillus carboniphilus]HHW17769.1 preprotein translocase subunit SecG [Candidatus Fermentithermobacillaceae bacterium]
MAIALRIFHWIVTIGLIVVVILQPGRSAGLGIIGGGAESLMGRKKKGLDALFSKLTVYLAIAFMATSIALAVVGR